MSFIKLYSQIQDELNNTSHLNLYLNNIKFNKTENQFETEPIFYSENEKSKQTLIELITFRVFPKNNIASLKKLIEIQNNINFSESQELKSRLPYYFKKDLKIGFIEFEEEIKKGVYENIDNSKSYTFGIQNPFRLMSLKFYPSEKFARIAYETGKYESIIPRIEIIKEQKNNLKCEKFK